jgi:hypothetical protein
MRHEDESRALSRKPTNGFHELVPRHEIESRRRLVEYERVGTRHQRARDQHAPPFTG